MTTFDPNSAAGPDSGVFGLPFSADQAKVVYLPVPWEVTTSYGGGTSEGPAAILEASRQVDLFDGDVLRPYEAGLHWLPESAQIHAWNREGKKDAQAVIRAGGEASTDALRGALSRVNALGDRLNGWVREESRRWLKKGKILGVVGGDHSVPFGAMEAVAETTGPYGILHFDAHSDTRAAYEGFVWSHASIFRNVLDRIPRVSHLVQVGIRDYCEQEWEFVAEQGDRVRFHSDVALARRKFEGEAWAKIVDGIVRDLPDRVWISFDIDGLDPRFCPHTGTPVPGGLDFNEAVHLIGAVARSGRTIVGFDLNEVAPGGEGDEWDANVGARLLYKLTAWTLASQKLAKVR